MRSRNQLRAIFAALQLRRGKLSRHAAHPALEDPASEALESRVIESEKLSAIAYKSLLNDVGTLPSIAQGQKTSKTIPVYSIKNRKLEQVGLSGDALPLHLRDALGRIPLPLWGAVKIKGIVFEKIDHIRGMYLATTGDGKRVGNVTAFYDHATGVLYAPQLRPDKTNSLSAKAVQARTLLHEMGHTLDYGLGELTAGRGRAVSDSDIWDKTVRAVIGTSTAQGLVKMTPKKRSREIFRTYLQYAFSSNREAFAEFFQWYIRGGRAKKKLQATFPSIFQMFDKVSETMTRLHGTRIVAARGG